jgi:hypothetical protein
VGAYIMTLRSLFAGAFASAILFSVACTLSASAVTIINTRTNAFSNACLPSCFGIDNLNGTTGDSAALPFTTATPVTITDINAYIYSNHPGDSITLGIMADSAGDPSGTFIKSTLVNLTSGATTLSGLSWSIGSGSFWLAAIASEDPSGESRIFWDAGVLGGHIAYATAGVNAWAGSGLDLTTDQGGPGVLEALIESNVGATPLPAALPMFMGGLGLIGLIARRRKQKAVAA